MQEDEEMWGHISCSLSFSEELGISSQEREEDFSAFQALPSTFTDYRSSANVFFTSSCGGLLGHKMDEARRVSAE